MTDSPNETANPAQIEPYSGEPAGAPKLDADALPVAGRTDLPASQAEALGWLDEASAEYLKAIVACMALDVDMQVLMAKVQEPFLQLQAQAMAEGPTEIKL